MLASPRQVLQWVRPTWADRYEIFAPDLGVPRAVLTLDAPGRATLQTRQATYLIGQPSRLAPVWVADADGAPIAQAQTSWWGHRHLQFQDGRVLRFRPSSLLQNRWLWSSDTGIPRAIVRQNQIFFSPDRPVREGFGTLLAGLSIYFLRTRPTLFF